jgi:hypothetical protein
VLEFRGLGVLPRYAAETVYDSLFMFVLVNVSIASANFPLIMTGSQPGMRF